MNTLYPGTIDFIKKITHLILYIQSKLQIPIIHFYFFIIKKKNQKDATGFLLKFCP